MNDNDDFVPILCEYCGKHVDKLNTVKVLKDFTMKGDEDIQEVLVCKEHVIPWELLQLRIAIRSLFEKEVKD